MFDKMAEEDYNKDAAFILEAFEGVSFAALSAQGRTIIGTPLVISNYDDERSPLTMQHRVQFSDKMAGVKVRGPIRISLCCVCLVAAGDHHSRAFSQPI